MGGSPADIPAHSRGTVLRHRAPGDLVNRWERYGRTRYSRCVVATRREGTQNLLCAYLAAAVLVGLLGNTLLGLWWLDPVAALIIVAVATKEGLESWRGDGCCEP